MLDIAETTKSAGKKPVDTKIGIMLDWSSMVRSSHFGSTTLKDGEFLLVESEMKTPTKKVSMPPAGHLNLKSLRVSRRISARNGISPDSVEIHSIANGFHKDSEKMGMTTRSALIAKLNGSGDQPFGRLECRWAGCSFRSDGIDSSLANHLLDDHVVEQKGQTTFECLWSGCKVARMPSKILSWLETHVVEKHCGSRPYRCFLCTLAFASKSTLEKHVDSHFPLTRPLPTLNGHSNGHNISPNEEVEEKKRHRRYFLTARKERIITRSHDRPQLPPPPKIIVRPKEVSPSPPPVVSVTEPLTLFIAESSPRPESPQENRKGKAVGVRCHPHIALNGFPVKKNKRRLQPPSRHKDFFDARTVLAAQEFVSKNLFALRFRSKVITFHSEIVCERVDPDGLTTFLVRWKPEGFVADCWVGKEFYKESVSIPAVRLIREGIIKLR